MYSIQNTIQNFQRKPKNGLCELIDRVFKGNVEAMKNFNYHMDLESLEAQRQHYEKYRASPIF